MALWGTADSLYSVGTVDVDYANKTITGTATSFTAAGISTGDVITIGTGGTFGSAVISGITSDLLISIATTQYLTGSVISGVAYTLSERPVYTLEDSNYSANVVGLTTTVPTHNVYGVDIYEAAALAPGNSGLSTQYGGIHAGWVGIHTYIDMHGNLRVKSETLVAMSGISTNNPATFTASGDANDDTIYPDRYITVSVAASPSNVVGVGTTVTFTASATATPPAALSYQWYDNTGILAGSTGVSTSIPNPTSANNGKSYYVVVTSTGGATATSTPITLTVS
jgi:hypothetical protein